MKKTLALILSVLLTFSCFAVCMASPVAAAESENLLADYDVYDFTFASDRLIADRITHNPGESYKGGYSFGARSVGWRGFYTTFSVEANTEYTLSFGVKSMYEFANLTIGPSSEITYNDANQVSSYGANCADLVSSTGINTKLYTANGSFKEEGQWVEISYTFTPTQSTDYTLAFSFKDKPSGSEASTDLSINPYYFALSDLSLTTPVADVEEETNVVNLLEGITVKDWVSSPTDNRVLTNAKETNVSRYGGYAFISTSVHYQGMRLPFSVKANTEYELSFSVKSSAAWQCVGVYETAGLEFSSEGSCYSINGSPDQAAIDAINANVYSTIVDGVADLSGVDAAQWTDVTIKFTPTANSDTYALYMSWGASLGYNNVIISDLKLTAKEAVPTYAVGNGAVKANPAVTFAGTEVTYTATPYQDAQFVGWYLNDEQISTETTISGIAGVDVPTARFTGNNLLANTTYADWESNSANITVTDATTESCYGGKNSVKLAGSWRGTHLTIANLEVGTEYTLSFNYYIPTHANGAEQIAFKLGTNVAYATDGQQSNGHWLLTKDITSPLDTWTEYTGTFTPNANSVDIAISAGWNGGIIMSDFSLTTEAANLVAATANAEGNGAVKADPAVVEYGQPATLIATPYQNDRFIGWFDSNNTLISIEKTYSVSAVYGAVDVTAKFTGNNIVADMTADDWYDINNTGYEGVSIVVDDATAESRYGGTAVKLAKDSAYRGTHIDIPAVTGGTYKIQVEVYRPEGASITNLTLAGAASYNPSSGQQANIYVWNQLTDSNGKKISETTTSGWLTYTGIFELTAGTDYDIYVECAGGCNGAIFSDISLVEYTAEADSLHTAHNNSLAIRGADTAEGVRSGSRIYNTISKDWIANKNIVEFGVLAIRTERLNGGDLTLNTPGVAYSTAWTSGAADSKLWNETEDKYEFTAVLINVAYKYFDDSYTMTTYAKDANGNIYYGDNQELSMYQSIYAILESENASEADKAVATELANAGSEKGDTTYEAWKAAWEA